MSRTKSIRLLCLLTCSCMATRPIAEPPGSGTGASPAAEEISGEAMDKELVTRPEPELSDRSLPARGGVAKTGLFRMCVGQDGQVTEVTPVESIPGGDEHIIRAVSRWVYKPRPTPVCFLHEFATTVVQVTDLGGVEGGVVGGVLGRELAQRAASSPGGAPVYAGAGDTKPRLKECVGGVIKLPERLHGKLKQATVKFSVGADGEISNFQVLAPKVLPDSAFEDAIIKGIRSCSWTPGADHDGKPVAMWVIQPIRFE
jgi:hypothetical protein